MESASGSTLDAYASKSNDCNDVDVSCQKDLTALASVPESSSNESVVKKGRRQHTLYFERDGSVYIDKSGSSTDVGSSLSSSVELSHVKMSIDRLTDRSPDSESEHSSSQDDAHWNRLPGRLGSCGDGTGEGGGKEEIADLRDPRSPTYRRSPSFRIATGARCSSLPPHPSPKRQNLPASFQRHRSTSQRRHGAHTASELGTDLPMRPLPYPTCALVPASTDSENSAPLLLEGPCVSRSFNSSDASVCRICQEGESWEDLVSPCHCAGSLGKLHLSCLERWLGASNTTRCEICHHEFKVERTPRPLTQFFHQPPTREDRRNLICDMVCFAVLTPLTIMSIFLCLMGVNHYSQISSRWEVPGLVSLITCLTIVYLTWCFVAVRHHYQVCRDWQKENQIVKIMYLSPVVGQTSFSTSAILEPSNSSNTSHNHSLSTSLHTSYLNPSFSTSNTSRQNVMLLSFRPLTSPPFMPGANQLQSQSPPQPQILCNQNGDHLSSNSFPLVQHDWNTSSPDLPTAIESKEASNQTIKCCLQIFASEPEPSLPLETGDIPVGRSPSQVSNSSGSFMTAYSSPDQDSMVGSPFLDRKSDLSACKMRVSSSAGMLMEQEVQGKRPDLSPATACSLTSFPQTGSSSASLWSRIRLQMCSKPSCSESVESPQLSLIKETSV